MHHPLVSVVIPVYNGENFLRAAVDSVLVQTYTNIEILVINDGSTDKTHDIAISYGDKIRYFSKGNGGVASALNMGINNMKGEYFSWLSHDDLYAPEKIELGVAALTDNKTGIAYSDYAVINNAGATMAVMNIAARYPNADISVGLFPILRQVLDGCTLLIHRSHFDRVGHFDEALRFTQDYDLWFRMFRHQRLTYVNRPLVMSREHSSSGSMGYEQNKAESDKLWLNMLENITASEICEISAKEQIFWSDMATFLSFTPYKKARAYAKKKLGSRKVSMSHIANAVLYRALSASASITRRLGVYAKIKRSKLFNHGYKIWFYVRKPR